MLEKLEELASTGVIRYSQGELSGEVIVERGSLVDNEAALELLALRGGEYTIQQRLPSIPVSRGTDHERSGSLAVHPPTDVMEYCEHVGLTGVVCFARDALNAEVVYASGDLAGIQLNGVDDLHEIFSWEHGMFRVETRDELPEYVTLLDDPSDDFPMYDDSGMYQRLEELAVDDILRERKERRPDTGAFTIRDALGESPSRPRRKDATVPVIYLGDPPASDKQTRKLGRAARPANSDSTEKLTSAQRNAVRSRGAARGATRSEEAVSPSSIKESAVENEEIKPSFPASLTWVGLTMLLIVAALAFLAALPPIS